MHVGDARRMSAHLTLREQQAWFLAASTHADGVAAGAEHASQALGRSLAIQTCLTESATLSAAERLEIYNTGYFGRLVECLTDDYSALAHLLGEERFDALARAYIDAFPSRSPSLNAYGARMAEFCGTLSEPWAPIAVDLARLEWALVEVIHAPSSPSLTTGALAAIPSTRWQTARLIPSPTLRLLCCDHPVN